MQPPIKEPRTHLLAFDFPRLFVEGVGWSHYFAESSAVHVDESGYILKPIAEKASFSVFECSPGADGKNPKYSERRKMEAQVYQLG